MFKLSSMYIPKLWVWKVKKKGKNMEYTHFDKHGNAVMVDVSEKAVTKRVAVAKGFSFFPFRSIPATSIVAERSQP